MMSIKQLVAAVILITPPPEAGDAVLSSLDENRDATVSRAELRDVLEEVVLPFDGDQDSALEPPELHQLTFHLCDKGDNLVVDGDEFGCVAQLIPGWLGSGLERLDTDMDSSLDASEFAGNQPRGIFDVWDSDRSGTIDAYEMAGWLVAAFDADGNDGLDAGELELVPIVWPVAATALTAISAR